MLWRTRDWAQKATPAPVRSVPAFVRTNLATKILTFEKREDKVTPNVVYRYTSSIAIAAQCTNLFL